MKVLRLLLVLIFMFTLFISPAQAKAGAEYGFVPLLTKVDPAIPLRVQARQAFNKLKPALLAAQKSGEILEFEPEFSAGILKIKYAAGARASTLDSNQVLDNIQAAAAIVPHEKPAGLQAAIFDPGFLLGLYGSCFYVENLGESSHVVASLRNKAGQVVANFEGDADIDGFLLSCFDFAGSHTSIVPGYKLTFRIYDSLGALLNTYITLVPNITFTTINKTNSVVAGTGPKSKPFLISWYHENLNAANTFVIKNKTGMISNTGQWSADFGSKKIRGGDEFWIDVNKNGRFTFEREFTAPSAYCVVNGNLCGIYGFPFQAATLNMSHAGVTHTVTGKFDLEGRFSHNLEDTTGDPIFLAVGDQVSATDIPAYTLPKLTAIPNYNTDIVSGKAPANKYFEVWVRDVYNGSWDMVWAHSNSTGVYFADFSSMLDLQAGSMFTFEIYYIDPVTGNATDRYISTGP